MSEYGAAVIWNWQGITEGLRGKRVPVPRYAPQTAHGWLGANPGLRVQKTATNRLSYGTAASCRTVGTACKTRVTSRVWCSVPNKILHFHIEARMNAASQHQNVLVVSSLVTTHRCQQGSWQYDVVTSAGGGAHYSKEKSALRHSQGHMRRGEWY
jgi:Tfp pilus assembly protein PilV